MGGLHRRGERSPPTQNQFEGDVMKTLIRIVKRGSANKDNVEQPAPAKPRLTTEMIVKRWIVDSREHRSAALSQLQSSVGWKSIGGVPRG